MEAASRSQRWKTVGRVLLFMVACAVALAAAAPLGSKLSGRWTELVTGAVSAAAALGLTLLFVRWERVSLADIGAAPDRGSPVRFLFGFLAGLGLVAVWASLSSLAGSVRWVRDRNVPFLAIAGAVLLYVVLACREELAFRGFPLRRMHVRFGFVSAQLFVALLFAAEHRLSGATWMDALAGVAVGSLLFGAAALATRGLAVPVGLHAAWNAGQWALGLKGSPAIWKGVTPPGQEGSAHDIGLITYALVIGTATIGFTVAYFRREGS